MLTNRAVSVVVAGFALAAAGVGAQEAVQPEAVQQAVVQQEAVQQAAVQQEAVQPTLLVIPARYTMVQVGADAVSMRPVVVFAYGGSASSDSPPLHVWNSATSEWAPVSVETYRSGSLFRATPRDAILVGADTDLPAILVQATEQLAPAKRVTSLDLVTVINALDESLKFTVQEWRWLASRYNLKLKDLNSDRRRYGKYGPPAGRKAAEAPLPPGAAAESPEALAPVPVESAPATAPDAAPLESAPAAVPGTGAAAPAAVPPPPAEKPENK